MQRRHRLGCLPPPFLTRSAARGAILFPSFRIRRCSILSKTETQSNGDGSDIGCRVTSHRFERYKTFGLVRGGFSMQNPLLFPLGLIGDLGHFLLVVRAPARDLVPSVVGGRDAG